MHRKSKIELFDPSSILILRWAFARPSIQTEYTIGRRGADLCHVNPPRPLASRRCRVVDLVTNLPNLPKPPNQSPRGRVYPPPTPSQTVGLSELETFFRIAVAPLTSKTLRKNEYFLFLDPFGPNTKRNYRHYKCHSTSICPK